MENEVRPSTGLSAEERQETIWLLLRSARENVEHVIDDMPAALRRDAIEGMRGVLDALELHFAEGLDEEVAS